MSKSRLLSAMIATILFLPAACSTRIVDGTIDPKQTSLQVSGTPGAQFTVYYKAGAHSGSITTTAVAGRPSTVVKLSGNNFHFNLAKEDQGAQLTAEILQGGKSVFRAEAPSGFQGVRITQTRNGWRLETY